MAAAGLAEEGVGLRGLGLGRTRKPLPACIEVKVRWGWELDLVLKPNTGSS